VADRLSRTLLPGGWLVVSPVEASATLLSSLAPIHFPGAIFFQKNPQSSFPAQVETRGAAAQIPPQSVTPAAGRTSGGGPDPSRTFMSKMPEVSPDLLREASALADRGRLDEAKRLCKSKLAQDRLNTEGHLLLAAICQERGEASEAKEALRHAVFISPDSIMAHFLLGSFLFREGERAKARRCLDTATVLLQPLPSDRIVPESGGLTAGHLLQTVRGYTDMLGRKGTRRMEQHRVGAGATQPSHGVRRS
jgi:chemotaxis protein methyltransferase CheR